MKLFDAFVFGQRERSILNLRVDTTCGVADHIIISIGSTSHSGDALPEPHLSPSSIRELRARCTRTPIHVVLVDTTPPRGTKHRSWHALGMQMNALAIKARQLGIEPSDLIVVSEHDEIPNPSLLASLALSGGFGSGPATAKLRTSYFYLYHAYCHGGQDWNAGFVANGAALDLKINRAAQYIVLPPSATPHNQSWASHNQSWSAPTTHQPWPAEAADSEGRVPLVVTGTVGGQHRRYPFINLMTLRLNDTHKVRGIDKHRAALGAPRRGFVPRVNQTDGFPADGFPPPHTFPNASWHLTTFMAAEDVLHKVRHAAHTECDVPPFNTLQYQQEAQRRDRCQHFCALRKDRGATPQPIAEPAALGPGAFPPAICKAEYSRFAPQQWCAKYHPKRTEPS